MNVRGCTSDPVSDPRETWSRAVLADDSRPGASSHQAPDAHSHPRGGRRHRFYRGHGRQGAPGLVGRFETAQSDQRADDGRHDVDHHDDEPHDHDDDHAEWVGFRSDHHHADDQPAHHHDDIPAHDDHDPAGGDVGRDFEIAGPGRQPPCELHRAVDAPKMTAVHEAEAG
jgi:hypothetical protein